jgi:hypothetical protein
VSKLKSYAMLFVATEVAGLVGVSAMIGLGAATLAQFLIGGAGALAALFIAGKALGIPVLGWRRGTRRVLANYEMILGAFLATSIVQNNWPTDWPLVTFLTVFPALLLGQFMIDAVSSVSPAT